MSKNWRRAASFVFALGVAVLIYSMVMADRKGARLARKAASYDEICAATKASISGDIFFLGRADKGMRDFTLERYDNARIAERTRLFEWCTMGPEADRPVTEEYLHAISACYRDVPCIVGVLKDVERKIDAGS